MLVDSFTVALPALLPVVALAFLLQFVISVLLPKLVLQWRLRHIPIANKEPGEWFDWKAVDRAQTNAMGIMKEAYAKFNGRPYQLISQVGRRTILPPHLIDSIKTDARLSSSESLRNAFSINIPGFNGLLEPTEPGNPNIFSLMVRSNATQNLSRYTHMLKEEAREAFIENWGMNEEWNEIDLMPTIRQIIARLSAKVFLGDEAARNQEWLNITIDYTVNLCLAQRQLRHFSGWSRYIVHWFLPRCIKLRQQYKRAGVLLAPILKDRMEAIKLAEKGLGKLPNDATGWMHETARGKPYDPVGVQLGLSVVALHTTSDLMGHILSDLCKHPEYVERMRDEIRQVLGERDLAKTSLYHMKLVDSVMKESQRVVPASMAAMGRMVTEDMTLVDGTFLPKGTMISVMAHRMWDPEVYPQPLEWQGDRYLKMRQQPGKENSSQFVTTGPEHTGFGHGAHACPGRFFSSNEIKIALTELLLNYDFECANEEVPKPLSLATEWLANPAIKLRIRRRRPEPLELGKGTKVSDS